MAAQDEAHGSVAERIEVLLGEYRIMVPALGALLGFQLIAGMQKTYEEITPFHRGVNFVGVACTLVAFGFMLIPSAYHRLTPGASEDESFIRLAERCLAFGFFFLSLSLTFALYLQAARSFQNDVGATVAAAVLLAFFAVAWWMYPRQRRRKLAPQGSRARQA